MPYLLSMMQVLGAVQGTDLERNAFYRCLKRPALSGGMAVKARNALLIL